MSQRSEKNAVGLIGFLFCFAVVAFCAVNRPWDFWTRFSIMSMCISFQVFFMIRLLYNIRKK